MYSWSPTTDMWRLLRKFFTANIIFRSYLRVVCFRTENQSFLQKKESNTQNDGQETHSAKMGAVVRPKIPQMPPKFSAQFVCPSPKVWDFRKKSSLWVSVVRALDDQTSLGTLDWALPLIYLRLSSRSALCFSVPLCFSWLLNIQKYFFSEPTHIGLTFMNVQYTVEGRNVKNVGGEKDYEFGHNLPPWLKIGLPN